MGDCVSSGAGVRVGVGVGFGGCVEETVWVICCFFGVGFVVGVGVVCGFGGVFVVGLGVWMSAIIFEDP